MQYGWKLKNEMRKEGSSILINQHLIYVHEHLKFYLKQLRKKDIMRLFTDLQRPCLL